MPDVKVGVMLPGEALAIAVVELIREIIKSQTPEVQKQMWDWYVEDAKKWRKFWKVDNAV